MQLSRAHDRSVETPRFQRTSHFVPLPLRRQQTRDEIVRMASLARIKATLKRPPLRRAGRTVDLQIPVVLNEQAQNAVPDRVGRVMLNICADVANALYWDFAIPRYRVTMEEDRGWVTLRGVVERSYQRSCAEEDARRVPGVIGVTNEITVGTA